MTANKTNITVEDCLRGAFQALLRGDTATRNRLCDAAMKAVRAGEQEMPADRPVNPSDLKPTIDGTCEEVPPIIYLSGPAP